MQFTPEVKLKVKALVLVAMLVAAVSIAWFYWSHADFNSIHILPIHIMGIALGYVMLNFLKKQLAPGFFWWDWLYYIGLASMMIPVLVKDSPNSSLFHWITDIGCLFLIIPVLLDGKKLMDDKKSNAHTKN